LGLSQNVTSSVVNIIAWLIMSAVIIILGIVVKVYLIAVLVPIGVNLLLAGIINFVNKKEIKIHKYIITALFSFLWASHLNNTSQIGVYILSSISISFSLSTIMI
jgi:energy-coupling factor transporter transmembrane protein EcfT